MKNISLFSFRGLFLGMLFLQTFAYSASQSVLFYVATNGSDAWSGRLESPNAKEQDGPLATLAGARDAIRRWKAQQPAAGPVEVRIRGGRYEIETPLVLDGRDSGSAESPVTYRAYPGESPVISGGRRITGWKREGKLWVAHLPEVQNGTWYFEALFADGTYQSPARAPNEGFFHIADVPDGDDKAFLYRPEELGTLKNLDDARVVAINSWDTSHLRIADVDWQKHVIHFTGKPYYPFQQWRSVQPYFILHAREALDQPGEWFLEQKTGNLYYMPLPGQSMRNAEILAPVAQRLLEIKGTAKQPVCHLTFEGLRFYHTNFPIPAEGFGPHQAAFHVRGAIYAEYMRNSRFLDCEIAHVSHYAMELNQGCQHNRIIRNHIHDLGAGGVRIGPPSRSGLTEADDVFFNEVDNNWIHDGGNIFLEGVGVWIGQSSYNTVSHNEIYNLHYTGVSLGWSWGYEPSAANHNIIEFNHIHHVGKDVLHDMGGIYSLGISPGTILRNNLIHDTGDECRGIYTDEGSSDMLIENNIVYNTRCHAFLQHYGKENRIINNIFAYAHHAQLRIGRREDHNPFFFERNIVYCNNGRVFAGPWDNNLFRLNRNCYWDASEGGIVFPSQNSSFEQWQRQGQDEDSIIADPLFRDPVRGDFRLRPDSPAITRLGFHPIDVDGIGLYGTKTWVQAPRKAGSSGRPFPSPSAEPVICDFERVLIGHSPEFASVDKGSAKSKGSIAVTDRKARAGRQSLLFQDAPELRNTRQPSLVLSPNYRQGILRAAFDLYLETGFSLQLQCRQDPFQIGPDLFIASDGSLYANPSREFFKDQPQGQEGKKLAELPQERWIHFEILCPLGRQANGTYTLRITDESGQTQRWENLPFTDPGFQRLDEMHFFSQAKADVAAYMDNISLSLQEKP